MVTTEVPADVIAARKAVVARICKRRKSCPAPDSADTHHPASFCDANIWITHPVAEMLVERERQRDEALAALRAWAVALACRDEDRQDGESSVEREAVALTRAVLAKHEGR